MTRDLWVRRGFPAHLARAVPEGTQVPLGLLEIRVRADVPGRGGTQARRGFRGFRASEGI